MPKWNVSVRGEHLGTVDGATARDARMTALSDFDVDDHRDIELSICADDGNSVQAGIDRTTFGAIGQP